MIEVVPPEATVGVARSRAPPQRRHTTTSNQETKARKPRFKTSEETMKDSDAGGDRLCSKVRKGLPVMILPQVHLRKPCYDFYFL